MTNKTTYLRDYQPTNFALLTVHLDFEIFEDDVLLSSQMMFQRRHPGELRLSGDDLSLVSVQLNRDLLSAHAYRLDGDDLVIDACPDEFLLTIVTRLKPQLNTQLSGLYRSNALLCTQCEPEGFRRMTYFYDRPDVLSKYTTRICADKEQYPVLLSNGNLIDAGDGKKGRHWVVWQDPFKKPSYLFALVAGHLDVVEDVFVTFTGKRVDLKIYVEAGHTNECAHAMNSLKKAMRWDEENYGREYDLSTYMIVAVSDFNMGAMENKGLNLFNAKYILARPETATDADYAGIERVVGHEYFHNWTGNRVTCRDWFQLSLKEGLTVFREQTFAGDMNSHDVSRIADVKNLQHIQFPEDASSMAHPVQPASYQEISNFYTSTIYNKGAEVIRMQQVLLGKAGFRRGMDLYFERHDGQAVTIDDFVAAMEDANDVKLTQFKRWYHQAGTPQVKVTSTFSQGQLSLTFTQTCPPTPECRKKEPFHIPIKMALFSQQGEPLPVHPTKHEFETLIELTKEEQTVHFNHVKEKPVVSLLRGFSAPIQLESDMDEQDWLNILRYETDGFAKWQAAQTLTNKALIACYEDIKQNIPATLLDAYHHILLDGTLDRDLCAALLTPPTFDEVANRLTEVDVSRVEDALDKFNLQLGQALYSDAEAMYQSLWQEEDHDMHEAAYRRRKLRQVCLRLMMCADEARTLSLCQTQFANAKTMTDQIGSLSLLAESQDDAIREKALDTFYRQWRNDALVLDKWFTIQAAAHLPNVLQHVKALLSHPDFNLKNPNRVRSLVVAFCQLNPRYFHAIDGSGYQFLTEQLIEIDKINPQLSARLAAPYTRWQRLDTTRQGLMKQALQQLHRQPLSKELSEVVSKSLIL